MPPELAESLDGRQSRTARSRLAICDARLDLVQEGVLQPSADQIALRAVRLAVSEASVDLLADTSVESIISQLEAKPPSVLVIDSIQTLYSEQLDSAPGSVSQLRECTAQLVRFAKSRGVAT